MWIKRFVSVLSVVVLSLGLFVSEEVSAKSSTPTIFVHGYTGDSDSLSGLILGLSGETKSREFNVSYSFKNVFKMKVNMDTKLMYSGQRMTYLVKLDNKVAAIDSKLLKFGDKKSLKYDNRFSVIHFSNASSSLNEQEKHLANVIKLEMARLKSNKVNLVGHSMGGLVSAQYAIKVDKSEKNVGNLITFGSPIKGSRGLYNRYTVIEVIGGAKAPFDLTDGGKVLVNAFKSKKVVLNNVNVVSFYGNRDEFVSRSSALGLKTLTNPKKYRSIELKSGHINMFKGESNKKAVSELKKIIK